MQDMKMQDNFVPHYQVLHFQRPRES